MKTKNLFLLSALLVTGAGSALAAVHYVDVNSTSNTPPYTSWATAATNIQDAVDAAVAGDEIVVTNGIYATGGRAVNRVMVDKPLSLRSINGPQFTTIDGGHSGRCVYLTNGVSLSGFTLTNGHAHSGGGVWCESTNAMVSNCVVSGNSVWDIGDHQGPASGGGASGGTLNSCILSGNHAFVEVHGFTPYGSARGGGASDCIMNNCTLTGNDVGITSGSVYGSAAGGGASGCTLNNCTLTGNSAFVVEGDAMAFGGGAYGCTLNNCTLTGNSATGGGWFVSGKYGGGAFNSTLNNCVIYFNSAALGANYDSSTLNYSCTTPLPTNGVGNITNEPAFVNPAAGNFRLRADSPCIDAGTNLSASITNDLDGRPRPLDGNGDGLAAFDLGAYEYRTPLLVWQDSPNPGRPYSSWATAATNIQDAVNAAVAGDEIVVTNGSYATGGRHGNRVAVDKPMSLRSVNGPQFTTIDAGYVARCVYLTNGASLSGFTLTNGLAGQGSGLWCESTTAVASNCVVSGNFAQAYGYGNGAAGAGAYRGTLNNCTLSDNVAEGYEGAYAYGAGAYVCTLNNCMLSGNSTYAESDIFMVSPYARGGGAYNSTLNSCTLRSNSVYAESLNNDPYSQGGGAYGGVLNNCTLSDNLAGGRSFWKLVYASGGGVFGGTLNNCIVYFNYAGFGPNYSEATMSYSCTTPDPGGIGNITNAPLFVDQTSGNLRLQSNSPCINAGNNSYVTNTTDLDGNPRIVGGTVDIGAYEFQSLDLISFGVVSNQFGFNVTGQSNWVFVLETSGDFTNWKPLMTNLLNGSPFPFREATSPILPQRFYRARLQ